MTITLIFLATLMGVFVVWLVRQSINVEPWTADWVGTQGQLAVSARAPKIGLFVFLCVVISLFALFASAYMMRMHMGDWRPLPEPKLLFVNTGILMLGSIGLQWAWRAASRGDSRGLKLGLMVGGAGAFAFMVGQLLVWQQLVGSGYFLAANPANAFFYLITGLHAVHIFGGLVAWGRTASKVWRGLDPHVVKLSVELCAIYWHFLLLLWLVLFYLFWST